MTDVHDGPVVATGPGDDHHGAPRLELTPRKVAAFVVFLVFSLVALYYLLPQLTGLEDTWHRIEDGDPLWLGLALCFTIASFGGYVGLFRGIFIRSEHARIGWRESYQITMAGLAATRLFAAGGAGGIVLTAWALRRSGMPGRQVADKSVAFLALTYTVYMGALIVFGYGLAWGVFSGPDPWAVTTLPASIGVLAFAIALIITLTPTDLQRRMNEVACRQGRVGRFAQKLANVPAAASAGIREALDHARSRDPALIGAVAFWGFQIAVLWAAFRAFGDAPPIAVLVMAFFVGMVGNLLPLPGGVGGVEGGMIGAFAAFGVDAGLALVAVLVYRAFVFWLPTIPGSIAYLQLRRTVERWRTEPARARA